MKKLPIKIITFVSLLLLTSLAFADSSITASKFTSHGFFSIAPFDQSVEMLSRLFGNVGFILPGSPGLMGALFRVFNEAILMIIVLTVLAYTVFRSVIETAHHGEFLGKKFDSLWVPMRVVGGIMLIVPTVSGYSIIQVIVMWVVLQGVGAADMVWKTALVYFQNNGNSFVTPPHKPTDNLVVGNIGQNIFAGLVCMEQAAKKDNGDYDTAPIVQPKFNFRDSTDIGAKNSVDFSYHGKHVDANCGSLYWISPKPFQSNSITFSDPAEQAKRNQAADKYLALQDSIVQLTGSLAGTAKNFVYLGNNSDQSNQDAGFNPVAIAATYINSSVYLASQNDSNNNLTDPMWQTAYDNGWVMAGAYYYTIASLNQQNSVNSSVGVDDITLGICNYGGAGTNDLNKSACSLSDPYRQQMMQAKSGGIYGDTHEIDIDASPVSIDPVSLVSMAFVSSAKSSFETLLNSTQSSNGNSGINPLIAVTNFGHSILTQARLAILVTTGVVIGMATIMGICSAEAPGFSVLTSFLSIGMPIFGMIVTSMYLIGLTLADYVPLVPYIIFFFGVIGWLLGVLESIIAAPLVALGVTYPEGHEMMGKADPALMLLANIFLRPMLMIFGLLAAMLLTYVGIEFINGTYGGVVTAIFNSSAFGSTSKISMDAFELIMIMAIYVGLVTTLLNKAFALIHQVPDQVLRWIGGQQGFGEYSGGEDQVRSIHGSAASQASEGGGKAASAGIEGGKETGKTMGVGIGMKARASMDTGHDSQTDASLSPGEKGGTGNDSEAGDKPKT